jgi:hypothetical protein
MAVEGKRTMTREGTSDPAPRRAVLYHLDSRLASELGLELSRCGCVTELASGGVPEKADIVFCPSARPILREALALFPRTPVVVVSRLPEVEGWLDALEEGAADYCAPPFETIQIRWLLETHAGARQSMAAA